MGYDYKRGRQRMKRDGKGSRRVRSRALGMYTYERRRQGWEDERPPTPTPTASPPPPPPPSAAAAAMSAGAQDATRLEALVCFFFGFLCFVFVLYYTNDELRIIYTYQWRRQAINEGSRHVVSRALM